MPKMPEIALHLALQPSTVWSLPVDKCTELGEWILLSSGLSIYPLKTVLQTHNGDNIWPIPSL